MPANIEKYVLRALRLAGLDWTVIQKPIQTYDDIEITGYKANI